MYSEGFSLIFCCLYLLNCLRLLFSSVICLITSTKPSPLILIVILVLLLASNWLTFANTLSAFLKKAFVPVKLTPDFILLLPEPLKLFIFTDNCESILSMDCLPVSSFKAVLATLVLTFIDTLLLLTLLRASETCLNISSALVFIFILIFLPLSRVKSTFNLLSFCNISSILCFISNLAVLLGSSFKAFFKLSNVFVTPSSSTFTFTSTLFANQPPTSLMFLEYRLFLYYRQKHHQCLLILPLYRQLFQHILLLYISHRIINILPLNILQLLLVYYAHVLLIFEQYHLLLFLFRLCLCFLFLQLWKVIVHKSGKKTFIYLIHCNY